MRFIYIQACSQTKFEIFYFRAVGANMGVTQYAAAKKAMIVTGSKSPKIYSFSNILFIFLNPIKVSRSRQRSIIFEKKFGSTVLHPPGSKLICLKALLIVYQKT